MRNPFVFGILALLTSFAPPALMMVAYGVESSPAPFLVPVIGVLTLLGSGHAMVTGALYLDPGARAVFSGDERYYYGLPASLTLGTAALFMALPGVLRPYAVMAFYLSAFWHHARQNVGVYAFATQAFGLGRINPAEKRALSVSYLGALFCGARWYVGTTGIGPCILDLSYDLGLAIFAVTLGYLAVVTAAEYRHHKNGRRAVLFFALGLYFAPVMIFDTWQAGLAWLAGHGLQYHLFVYYALYRPGTRRNALGVNVAIALAWPAALLCGICLAYHQIAIWASNIYSGGADTLVFGLIMGWVLSHYAIDARIWRMSDPIVRQYHRRGFGFLLGDGGRR